jgi:hypothetical protein
MYRDTYRLQGFAGAVLPQVAAQADRRFIDGGQERAQPPHGRARRIEQGQIGSTRDHGGILEAVISGESVSWPGRADKSYLLRRDT